MARRAAPIELSEDERAELERWVDAGRGALGRRARVVLLAADGRENQRIAAEVGLGENAVGHWRRRFRLERLAGLGDRAGRGRKRKYGAEARLAVVLGCQPDPDGRRPSVRRLAASLSALGMSKSTVARLLKTMGPDPAEVAAWLSPLSAPERRAVELGGVLVLPRLRVMAVAVSGSGSAAAGPAGSVTTLLAAALAARREASGGAASDEDGRRAALRAFVGDLDRVWPVDRRFHLVTHGEPGDVWALAELVRDRSRFHLHPTPGAVSWRGQLEVWLSILGPPRGLSAVFADGRELTRTVLRFLDADTVPGKTFRWLPAPFVPKTLFIWGRRAEAVVNLDGA